MVNISLKSYSTNILVFFKREPVPSEGKVNLDYLLLDYAQTLIKSMLNNRYQELLQDSNTPFLFAAADNGQYYGVQTKDALQLHGVSRQGGVEESLAALIREAKRIRDFGFTAGEYERARANYLSGMEKMYNERDKQQNGFYINAYVEHFLNNEPIPSIADRYSILTEILPHIPVEVINEVAKNIVTENNRVIVVMSNEPTNKPTVEALQAAVAQVDKEELTAYEDEVSDEPLLSELPKSGSIVSEDYDKERDI